jgi:hypothetical protein
MSLSSSLRRALAAMLVLRTAAAMRAATGNELSLMMFVP